MACNFPLTAYRSKEIGASGKRGITFNRNASFSGIPIMLPCQQCINCRLAHAGHWAARMMHEHRMVNASSFITLTYDKEPSDGSLSVRDLQLFNKRLRKRMGRFRFFACGEYGERNNRPHYHSVLFGLEFPDLRFYKTSGSGERLYTSDLLEDIWGKGLCVVGDVTYDSCCYVARYVVDKVTGDKADDWYMGRTPEFTTMSRRPGIGASYYEKYGDEVYVHDSIIVNGKPIRPPRYYDVKREITDPERIAHLKQLRRRAALKHRSDNTPERRRVRETVTRAKIGLYRRDVS